VTQPPTGAPVRVLLVEDDRFLRKAAEVMLRRQGFTVSVAEDGQAGLETAREQRPDAILCDLIMPRMQGLEVIEALKADARTSAIPVLVMSNLGQEGDVQRALAAGAVSYVVKSNIALQDLGEHIRSVLAARPA